MIDQILTNEYFLLALTFGIYQGAKMLQRRTGSILLNPILIAIGLMIAFLTACDIPYDTYHKSGQMIEFWLKPAVVALGVPLYLQLSQIKYTSLNRDKDGRVELSYDAFVDLIFSIRS